MRRAIVRVIWPPTLGLGLVQAWAADHWRERRGTSSSLALLVWAVARPAYVVAYRVFVAVARP